jgi:transcription initiation factor TFIIIB Brf1 subunit/transcription initiation factor TFIIB
MVPTQKLTIACPQCGSMDVSYSCSPSCCFNHVCAECFTTFEPATEATGRMVSGVEPPKPLPEAADPTAACARCESIRVYRMTEEELVCAECGAVLRLVLNEIVPG